jgi:methyl-accepting chemotaxis protein
MMNLCSLSRAMLSIFAAIGIIALAGLIRIFLGPAAEPWDTIIELLAAGASLGFGAWSLRQAARGVRTAATVCAQAAHGNLEARIPGMRDGGDLGSLQKSVNDMLDIVDAFVRESAASMEYVSRGKCFRKVVVRGLPNSFRAGATVINAGTDAMDRKVRNLAGAARGFGSSMEVIAKTLATAANALESDAGSMAAAAEETSRQSTAVAAASEQASVNVQTVASAAEELSASIAEISRQVVNSTSGTTRAVADAGQANAQIENLAEAAQRIGDVVKLISDIAEQTNLLALNATIEAARAGEAGKGFAVVASEVKTLSDQTSRATDEIRGKISEMQTATTQSVQAMQTVGQTIGEISEVSTAIASAVEQQGAATKEIARNVQQASIGTAEVSSNIVGINQAAADTGLIATRVSGASQRISGEVNTLRAEVEKFLDSMKAA